MRKELLSKILVMGVVVLFIGVSVVSSRDNIVKDIPIDSPPLESVYSSEGILSFEDIVYAFCVNDPSGQLEIGPVYFNLDNPGDIEQIASGEYPIFSGGTSTYDLNWLVCDSWNGNLYEINIYTGVASIIGGGDVALNGLAHDPVYDKLYGCSENELYKINQNTGAQTYIGNFGSGPVNMKGIAIDLDGVLFGWDTGTDNLWEIDKTTAECELIGPLGVDLNDLNYAQDGAFDFNDNILWLAAYTDHGFLAYVDMDTGEIMWMGDFQGGAELTAFVFPQFHWHSQPVTTISFNPPVPDGLNGWYVSNVTATLNATDNDGVNVTYYRINSGKWKIYNSPFVISEDGEDILIEYLSVDNLGNEEYVKSATLDIDKTPPNMTVDWEVEKVGWRKWRISFTITSNENTSGMDRLEIYLNDALQWIFPGSGPTYSWSFIISSGVSFKFIAYDIASNYAIVVVNDTDISYHNCNRDIFTQQYSNPLILRLLERFPLLERILNSIQWGSI